MFLSRTQTAQRPSRSAPPGLARLHGQAPEAGAEQSRPADSPGLIGTMGRGGGTLRPTKRTGEPRTTISTAPISYQVLAVQECIPWYSLTSRRDARWAPDLRDRLGRHGGLAHESDLSLRGYSLCCSEAFNLECAATGGLSRTRRCSRPRSPEGWRPLRVPPSRLACLLPTWVVM